MLNRLYSTPHRFSKLVVIACLVSGVLFSAWGLRILSRTGHDPAPLLTIVLAFLGGELTLLCGKTIVSATKRTIKEESYD